jgi:hypothetical protein
MILSLAGWEAGWTGVDAPSPHVIVIQQRAPSILPDGWSAYDSVLAVHDP